MQHLMLSVVTGNAGSIPLELPLPQFVQATAARRSNRWRAFAASVVLHLAVLVALSAVSPPLREKSGKDFWSRHRVMLRTLRLRVPEPLYLASAGPGRPRPVVVQAAAAAKPAVQAGQARSRPGAGGRRRRLDLPPLEQRVPSDQSIIQPQYAADLMPSRDLHLPEVFF